MKVAIIGGGPSGLASLKWLATAHEYFSNVEPIEVRLFEAERDIGGTFRYRVWKDAELVSSKYLTAFSDHRFAADSPEFVTPEAYVAYMQSYVDRFGLAKHIECLTKVTSVSRTSDGRHVVKVLKNVAAECMDDVCLEAEDWVCDAVVVCSGLNVNPNIPDIPGIRPVSEKLQEMLTQEYKEPRVIHSSTYKNTDIFNGASTVVILGAGETAMDIGHQAINHTDVRRVILCHREGFMIAPKRTPEPIICGVWGAPYPGKRPNKPIDTTVASLFDTMYVAPAIQRGQLLWIYYDWWIKFIFITIAGTTWGIDQWVGGVPQVRRHSDSLFIVKSDKLIPWLSGGRRKGIWNAIRTFFINVPIYKTNGKPVDIKPFPTHMTGDGLMHFPKKDTDPMVADTSEDEQVKADVVVMATGYRTEFPFLKKGEYPTLAEAKTRGIYRNIEDGIAYVGFVRPSIGAIPPLSELQAQLWVLRLLQHHHCNNLIRRQLPSPGSTSGAGSEAQPLVEKHQALALDEGVIAPYEVDYALHARGGYDFFATKRGVDHDSYAYQLGLDMGAVPSFTHMVRHHGWRAVFTWAMGPNFNTKLRLVGPWARPEEAAGTMEGELYHVVKRTGGRVFFVTYTVTPLILFGILSLFVWLYEQISGGLVDLWEMFTGACFQSQNQIRHGKGEKADNGVVMG